MPRVTFLRDFDCPAKPGVFVAYKAGHSLLIPRAHAERASAAGVLADGKVSRVDRALQAPHGEDPARGEGSRGD